MSSDYTSPVTKINLAVDKLPEFKYLPNKGNTPQPHHFTTIHMNCESMNDITKAYKGESQAFTLKNRRKNVRLA